MKKIILIITSILLSQAAFATQAVECSIDKGGVVELITEGPVDVNPQDSKSWTIDDVTYSVQIYNEQIATSSVVDAATKNAATSNGVDAKGNSYASLQEGNITHYMTCDLLDLPTR